LDGSTISEADSLDDIINGNGTTPLYYIVRHGDSYKVMLYLPDPSDIDEIDIVVDDSSSNSDPEGEDENDGWFLWVMIALSVILALVVIILVVSRRGPRYDGLDEFEDDDDDEPDYDMISESKRNTYRMLLEE